MSEGPPYKSAQLRMMCAMTNPPKPLGFDVVVDGKTVAVLELAEFARAAASFSEADGKWRQHRQRLTVVEPESYTPRRELEKRVNAMLNEAGV